MQAMRRISLVLVVFGGIASCLVGVVWLAGALRDTESAQLVEASNRSYGSRLHWYPFSALGDEEKARARIKSIVAVAAAINDGATFNINESALLERLNRQTRQAGIEAFVARLTVSVAAMRLGDRLQAGGGTSASAATDEDFKRAWISSVTSEGYSDIDARRIYYAGRNKSEIDALMAEMVITRGDQRSKEALERSLYIAAVTGTTLPNPLTGAEYAARHQRELSEGLREEIDARGHAAYALLGSLVLATIGYALGRKGNGLLAGPLMLLGPAVAALILPSSLVFSAGLAAGGLATLALALKEHLSRLAPNSVQKAAMS